MDEIMETSAPLIEIHNKSCHMCYACVRACPVKAIVVKPHKQFPEVVHERCIGCGSCISICSPGAITYRDSKATVMNMLKDEKQVAAVCDPAIASEFDDISDYRKFVEMLKSLGFQLVLEAAFAADLVAREYYKLFSDFKGKYYITANCPATVAYIEKYHPDIIDNLAPIVSPMVASAKITRKKYGSDTKVVYISPCIAHKEDAKRHNSDGLVDAVLTFKELRELFSDHHITESNLEYSEFDQPHGYKGYLFPVSNGIIQTSGLNEDLLDGHVITAEGKHNMLDAVNEFDQKIEQIGRHFNIFYNEGCIQGPGNTRKTNKYLKHALIVEYTKKRNKKFSKKLWNQHLEELGDIDLSREFVNDDQRLPNPSKSKIKEILKVINKENNEDKLSCESCGYQSCEDFAIAVGKGLAKTDMCVTYTLKNRQEYIKTLKSTNEKLSKTQKALEESEKKAQKEKEAAKEASEITNLMLEKLRAGVVIMDKNLKIVQSNARFVNILGDEAEEINEVVPGLIGADIKTLLPFNIYNLFSYVLQNNENVLSRDVHYNEKFLNLSIFTIKQNKIIGAIIRDMFLPEVQKEEVIKRVTEVIDKNLEMVQKIGFLLGEGASETEQMLNSIIEFHKTGKKSDHE